MVGTSDGVRRYGEYSPRHSTGYSLQPAGYSGYSYSGPLKEYYTPRYNYNYLPPQYNDSGYYSDYLPSRRSQYYSNYSEPSYYTSPMGYRTLSDRRYGEAGYGYGGWEDRYLLEEPGPYQTIDEMLGRLYSYDYSRPCELRLVRPLYQPMARSTTQPSLVTLVTLLPYLPCIRFSTFFSL